MKLKISSAILPGAMVLFFTASVVAKGAPSSSEQLRNDLESALRDKDTNAVLSLVNWNGVSSEMKSETTSELTDMMGEKIAAVKLLPLDADFRATNEMDGVRYFPNVRLQGLIDVESVEKGNAMQLPYGQIAGKFFISGTRTETFDAHASRSETLGIMVLGLFPKPEVISGSYTYVEDGHEFSEPIVFTNNTSFTFWGDYIKSCKFTKSGGNGSMRLLIHEGGTKIFDSGLIKTNDSVVYERKQ